jgi:hypothetical protein
MYVSFILKLQPKVDVVMSQSYVQHGPIDQLDSAKHPKTNLGFFVDDFEAFDFGTPLLISTYKIIITCSRISIRLFF